MDFVKGQLPSADGKCACDKCRKVMREIQFYTYKDKSKTKLCKQCMTLHVDNFDPETFLWILEDLDVPYVAIEWNKIRDKEFAKDPSKLTNMSVLGKYLAKMKLKQWKNYGWADSEELTRIAEHELAAAGRPVVGTAEERAIYEAQVATLKEQLEKGEISRAQYETLMPTEVLNEETISVAEQMQTQQSPNYAVVGANNAFDETQFLSEDQIPDYTDQLTDEDKIALALKWGRLYRPSEWVELEKFYTEMTNSFDIQDADTRNTLILICKTNLKMNQAIDGGDLEGYKKLTTVYDSLRKSAKFTAAQNKNGNGDFVNSVGELVDMCEREGGFIPRWITDIPQDKVDYTLKDMNNYVYNLVTKDLGFGQQIETYLKKIELEKEAEKAMDESDDGVTIDIEDEDIGEYYEDLEEQKDKDNDIYLDAEEKE